MNRNNSLSIEKVKENPSLLADNEYDDGEDQSMASSEPYKGSNFLISRPTKGLSNEVYNMSASHYGDDDSESRASKKQKISCEIPVSLSEIKEKLKNPILNIISSSNNFTECWGCKNGLMVATSEKEIGRVSAAFDTIAKIINKSLYNVSIDHLIHDIKKIYDNDIKEYTVEKEEWSHESIKEHFFEHVNDPALDMKAKLNDFQTLFQFTKDSIIKQSKEDPSTLEIDPKLLHCLGYLNEQIRKLYSTSPEKSPAFRMGITPYSEYKNARLLSLSKPKNN